MASKQTEKSQRQWEALLICPNRTMSAELAGLLCSEVQLTGVVARNVYPKPQELMAGTLPSASNVGLGCGVFAARACASACGARPGGAFGQPGA